jgi:bacterioferritin
MLENDLRYEYEVATKLNEGIAVCVAAGDNASRALLEDLPTETENDHILWLEAQVFLIEDLGLQNYLAQQL